MKKILLIGGAGYVGTELTLLLLKNDYLVTVYDLFIYGDCIGNHENLIKIKGDVRDIKKIEKSIQGQDLVIHLACISNDPSFDLNPELAKSINYDFFEDFVKRCKDNGVKKLLFASSSSVYGVKKEKNVSEDISLEPLTDYSKYKAMCEEVVLKYYDKNFICCILRPATCCGYSKRQRFDLIVNILTNHAFNKKIIKVFGGEQLRPNINIIDMCRAYMHILNSSDDLINGEIFNVGQENLSVNEIAILVKNVFKEENIEIIREKTDDNRSYHISSKKIISKLGFVYDNNIEGAINNLKACFKKNLFKNPMDNTEYFNIKRMKEINLI